MAVKPEEVIVDYEQIDYLEREIDKRLSDREWVRNNRENPDEKTSFVMVFSGELSSAEKRELASRYENVGWGVKVRNSSENDERAGLFRITLSK